MLMPIQNPCHDSIELQTHFHLRCSMVQWYRVHGPVSAQAVMAPRPRFPAAPLCEERHVPLTHSGMDLRCIVSFDLYILINMFFFSAPTVIHRRSSLFPSRNYLSTIASILSTLPSHLAQCATRDNSKSFLPQSLLDPCCSLRPGAPFGPEKIA